MFSNPNPSPRYRRGLSLPILLLVAVALLMAATGAGYYFLQKKPETTIVGKVASPEVFIWDSPFDNSGSRRAANYEMLPSASRPWRVTAFFPHMKDSYWMAVNYGLVEQARRLGVILRIRHAGGYEHLPVQVAQMRECIRSGEADAIILAAISYDGLNEVIAEAKAKGIPVVDSVNGVSSHDVSARSLITFEEMARKAGEHLAELHPAGSPKVKLAWFPGPEGAGWVMTGDTAFKKGLAGSSVEIVETLFGDTGAKSQAPLVGRALEKHADLDYVAGNAVAAEVAPGILRQHGADGRVKIVATYLTPGVHRHLQRGAVKAAMTDAPVDLGRIALDQAVRLLEKKPVLFHVEPPIRLLELSNLADFDRTHAFAPDGFEPVFTVNATLPSGSKDR